jgi:uncharacterized protein YcfL
MNKLVLIIPLALVGCSSFSELPNSNLVVDKEIRGMSRNEVIMAINECEVNRTRAVVIMAKQKISGRTTDVVTDVTCAPKYTY